MLGISLNQLKNQNNHIKFLWLLPIIYGLLIVAIFGVNVIFWDEWEMVKLYDNIEQNGFFHISTLKMLLSQHNEHRIIFPEIFMLIIDKLTHFNSKIQMFIIQIMVIGVYLTYIKYIINKSNSSQNSSNNIIMTIFILMIGLACFSSIQYENFLWGFQIAFYMSIFEVIISLYFFNKYIIYESNKYCILSLLFGITASFSSLHGLIIWPVIAILILICLISNEKSILKKAYQYILIGTICFIIYFYKWNKPLNHPDYILNIYKIIKFIFGSIGGMYTGSYSKISVLLGGMTVLLSAVLILRFYYRKDIKSILFPIGLIGYSYAALLSIAIGRTGFGVEISNSSRYMSFSVLSYIGITIIFYQCFVLDYEKFKINKTMKYIKKVSTILLYIFSILLIWGNIKGLQRSKNNLNYNNQNLSILQNYEQQPIENLNRLYPFGTYENANLRISKLKKLKLNAFTNTIYSYNKIPLNRVSYLKKIELNHWLGFGQESFLWDNDFIIIPSGWAIDYITQKEYTQVYMKVNDNLYRTADHLSSKDVAKHFENSHYNNVRFYFSFPIDDMSIGENYFSILVILNDGLTYYESDHIIICKSKNGNLRFNTTFLDINDITDFESIQNIKIPKNISEVLKNDINSIDFIDNIIVLHCGVFDPQIIFIMDNTIKKPEGDTCIEIECSNTVEGNIQFFYDFGNGFNERNSISIQIDEFQEIRKIRFPIIGWVPEKNLISVRIDPPDGSVFSIRNLEILTNMEK